uniref:Transposase n=1 Tax=Globodera pallida TaxID=36090 RepID=A0A183CEB6_GLOPA
MELANAIQSARDFVKAQAVGKLEVIAEQMEFLRKVYYLYRQCSGGEALRRFFSLISPEEWGGERALERRSMQFLGAYRLEFDQTWSRQDANEAPNSNRKMQILGQIDKFLVPALPSDVPP